MKTFRWGFCNSSTGLRSRALDCFPLGTNIILSGSNTLFLIYPMFWCNYVLIKIYNFLEYPLLDCLRFQFIIIGHEITDYSKQITSFPVETDQDILITNAAVICDTR